MGDMKTTIEIADPLFRQVKSLAAGRGQTLKDFVAEALQARLAAANEEIAIVDPKWMEGFGKLQRLRKETARIEGVIDEAFEVIEAEDRQ